MPNEISKSLLKLENYIIKAQYKGFDPYDALTSPFFQLPLLKSFRPIRFATQQVVRRSRVNLRPLLFVSPGLNPVTLGLSIQAYTYLTSLFPEKSDFYHQEIYRLIDKLQELQSSGYSGACWGYNFDWESRYDSIPAFTPTAVATGIITNSLFTNHQFCENKSCKELCINAAQFVLNDLNKTFEGEKFCYSYSPLDRQIVFNATMKAARILAQAYSLTGNTQYLLEAKKTVAFVMHYQRSDGAWVYAHRDARKWVDNYHTGYILECLGEYINLSNDHEYEQNLTKGLNYYFDHFIESGKIPKFYDQKTYPVDCTAAAQLILTLLRFDRIEVAKEVGIWMIENMQDDGGSFYFRKFSTYVIKTPFMRWSNAWMLLALSRLMYKLKTTE